MSEPHPTAYCYQFSEGEHRLYFGGISTLDGIQLLTLDESTPVEVSAAWFDESGSESQTHERVRAAKTIQELTAALAQTWSLHDFTCNIKSNGQSAKLSTHDDAECHFILPSKEACRDLVFKACPNDTAAQLWDKLVANHGSYVCFDESKKKLSVFQTFTAYLKSRE